MGYFSMNWPAAYFTQLCVSVVVKEVNILIIQYTIMNIVKEKHNYLLPAWVVKKSEMITAMTLGVFGDILLPGKRLSVSTAGSVLAE